MFSAIPTYGHVYPSIPLAKAARDAGHEVLYATHTSFHNVLASFNFEVVPVGTTVRQAVENANDGPARPSGVFGELGGLVFGTVLPRAFATDLIPMLERVKPDLVVQGMENFGAFLAARHAGVPSVWQSYGRVVPETLGTGLPERVGAVAKEFGVELSSATMLDGGDPVLDICPSSLQNKAFLGTVERIPLRPIPVSEPGELPARVSARARSRPLIYLTLGTVFGVIPVLRQAIDGLAVLDADVLVATGPSVDASALGANPENVRVVRWVPQAELFPHVDLVVHHGGSGTTLGALATGIPQLVLPQGADHFSNAEAVVTARAGAVLGPGEVTPESVAAKAKDLLGDDAARAAAQAVAAEIAAMPSPEATVDVLTALASHP